MMVCQVHQIPFQINMNSLRNLVFYLGELGTEVAPPEVISTSVELLEGALAPRYLFKASLSDAYGYFDGHMEGMEIAVYTVSHA
jgi:hypothetical protein